MGYKHIIWDWNGTLLNDRQFCIKIMNGVLSRRDMDEMTEEWFLDNFCFPVKDYYVKLGFDFDKEPFSISGTEFIHQYMKRIHEPDLHLYAQESLKYFQNNKLSQSLLSASSQTMLNEILQYHDIHDYFIKIVGQDDHYAHGKESSGKAWMDELDCGPHEVLLIGDTIHDKEVADAIGADCVLVCHGHVSRWRLEETGASVFENLKGVINWFEGQDNS
ncbi:MAG TPA: HAD family hydrolase [Candidatus Marinimicrobia bacterium]|jgi:phosphoglycolate phosphatase|nr:HAD family hydrolase [Candidatus Neomarinimicrobiota bacterium]HIB33636.1 HAD family hydrolase [Candidatus Neomarinimicrobiota bacterium]